MSTAALAEITQTGAAMAALTEKQRRYVIALFEAPKSHGALTFAAKRAGYGTPTSSRQSLSQMAHALNADPKIQAAIAEVSQQYTTVLGPHAVRALKKLLDDPKARDHGRALGIVMDRVSPVQSTAIVKVEGKIELSAGEAAHVLERIEELAAKFAVALPAPKIIEHDEAAA
jgi:phage terminase small subunit